MKISSLFHCPQLKRFFSLIKRKLSLITLLLIFSSFAIYNIQSQQWLKQHKLIKDDVQLYYIYTSAVIVYGEYDLGKAHQQLPSDVRSMVWLHRNDETNRNYSKMAMGMSMIYAPFTAFTHHVIVPLTDYPADGYSPPYKIALLISGMCFFLIGLWQLRKLLLKYFSESITALTLIVIAFGTNITWYASYEATMSHVYSFALVLFFYRMLDRWFEKPGTALTLLNGFLFGLIVLIRPTNIMFIVLFFTGENFGERIRFLMKNYRKLLIMVLAFLMIWFPQLLFWKWASGEWFLYSYGDEVFFWNNPQVISSLFSYRKGWLVYTPLMALLFVGLPVLWIKYRRLFWQVFMVVVLAIFINSSWWCWWYGGSYGNRSYIDAYGIYALAIAALFQAIAGLKKWMISVTGFILVAAFVFLNLFQTWQYSVGLINFVSETKSSYWINFLQTKPQQGYYENLILPDHKLGTKGIFYSYNEKTEPEKSLWKNKVEVNKKFLLSYLTDFAKQNKELKLKISSGDSEYVNDSVYRLWAEKEIEAMKSRPQ